MQCMYAHREADRVPIVDQPWPTTVDRWRREGLPTNMDYAGFLGMDRVHGIRPDNSPQFPVQVLEETDEYRIYTLKGTET
jgi:uroporphyrinogen decarboxylase